MKGVSKRIVKMAAVTVVVAAIAVQPALAAPKSSDRTTTFGSVIRAIIRVLDTIEIRLPPG
jgi:hypothetical protein